MEKKKGRRFKIRLTALLLAGVLTMTVVWNDYKNAQALATPLDLLGVVVMELTMYFAGLSAGEKSSDIVQSNPYKSADNTITDNPARDTYVAECFPSDVLVEQFGWNGVQYDQFICSMSALWATSSYVVTKDFCDKLWSAFEVEGSNAVKPEDIVINEEGATILQMPQRSPEPDDDSEDDAEENLTERIFDSESNSVASNVVSGIFSTKAFVSMLNVLLSKNAQTMEENLTGAETAVCDYSKEYWQSGQPILTIADPASGTYGYRFNTSSSMEQNWSMIKDGVHIYPLTFEVDGVPQIGFALDDVMDTYLYQMMVSSWSTLSAYHNTSSTFIANKYAPIILPNFNNSTSINFVYVDTDKFMNYYKAHNVLKDVKVDDANIINVGTLENFNKWIEYVQTGDYTFAELLNLMEKGWVVDIAKGSKEWEGVGGGDNKLPQEVINDPIIKEKYEHKKDSDTETEPDTDSDTSSNSDWKISFESMISGVELNYDMPYGQPLYEFLGDPVQKTETEPGTNPDTDPGTETSPETDPDSDPGTETSPETDPDSDPETVPDNDTDTDSEKDEAPSYDYVSGNQPDVDVSWWGDNYVPSQDPDPEDPQTTPAPDDKDDISEDDTDKPPVIPGYDPDDDSKNVNWYERFPFCIPYDIYRVSNWFVQEEKAPKWNMHFYVKSLNIDEVITIDFTKFDNCTKVIKAFILLFYVAGLIKITRDIIRG